MHRPVAIRAHTMGSILSIGCLSENDNFEINEDIQIIYWINKIRQMVSFNFKLLLRTRTFRHISRKLGTCVSKIASCNCKFWLDSETQEPLYYDF